MVLRPSVQPACQGIQAKVNGMVGDCKPLGYFDPLGFAKEASPASMKKCATAARQNGAGRRSSYSACRGGARRG